MRRPSPRVAGVSLALLPGLLATVPGVALAHSSTTEAVIRGLNEHLMVIAAAVAIVVEGVLAYAIWRSWRATESKPTEENRRLELGWTIVTAVILLYVGTVGFQVMASPAVTTTSTADVGEDALVVEVIGQQWEWTFHYPEQNVTTDVLVLPTDRDIVLRVTSKDVIHSMHVPGLGLKKDAMPGQWNSLGTRLSEQGTYRFYCAEYCGVNHSDMTTRVRVVSPERFSTWLDSPAATNSQASRAGPSDWQHSKQSLSTDATSATWTSGVATRAPIPSTGGSA